MNMQIKTGTRDWNLKRAPLNLSDMAERGWTGADGKNVHAEGCGGLDMIAEVVAVMAKAMMVMLKAVMIIMNES